FGSLRPPSAGRQAADRLGKGRNEGIEYPFIKNTMNTFMRRTILAAGSMLGVPGVVLAESNPFTTSQNLVNGVGTAAGLGQQQTLPVIVGRIINVALGFIGIVLLVLLLLAGFNWMTAGGDTEKVKKAQQQIKNAIIGLVIIVAAFAISNFVLSSLINVAQ
ncbi:MAG TPA: pilin, partial [Candidatus Methylomirabilis sp.]|nr:pilin [Candidatus Methylomirabilis sp.]